MQHLPDSVVFYPHSSFKTYNMKKIIFAFLAMISMLPVIASQATKICKPARYPAFTV